jgi:hypothetical protein
MDTWIEASTQTMEAYVKLVGNAGAVVFRFKGSGDRYASYVMPDAQSYVGAVAFPCHGTAREWADKKLRVDNQISLEERAIGE